MIGDLDRRITLQSYTETANAFGEKVPTWSTLATVWAGVMFKDGGERLITQKETVTADVIFTIRYRSTVSEKTRIVWDSVNYDILHIAEVDRKRYLELAAQKVQ
jgi:SPP1 family predicted phage head-tail adaptor